MLDKIVVLSCRKQAYMIFTDRPTFGIYSDKDVTIFLRWFFNDPTVHLQTDMWGNWTGQFEVRKFDDEITMKIVIKEAA